VGVIGYMPVTAATGHAVTLVFPSSAAGATLDFSDNCSSVNCPVGIIDFDANPDLEEDNSDPFFITAGTIHISSVSGGRITGTFSGDAEDYLGNRFITITGGTFDVPLLDDSSFPASRSAPVTRFLRLRR